MQMSNQSMNDVIFANIETMNAVYLRDPNRILQDYRKETAEIEGYHGRELLELLQNAVDELESATKRFVCVELKGNKLRFSNNGNFFSEDGITSLMYSNLSPKHKAHKYIGNKGTGFRSVLNWANRVRIFSGDLSIEFSAECADELLTELLKNSHVNIYQEKHPDLKVATLVAPKIIETLVDKEYDTVIEIDVKEAMAEDVQSQIDKIDSRTLLFLNKLEKLTIIHNAEKIEFEKSSIPITEEFGHVKIRTLKNDEINETEDWLVSYREDEVRDHHYSVSVAYKTDMSVKPDVLYSYFKTQIELPLPVLIHGTFDLSANRNHLNETSLNKVVLEAACKLLIDTAVRINEFTVDYAPLTLLSLKRDFPTELAWTKIDEFYLKAIADSKVFPTVNSKYISFVDNPKFFVSRIADFVMGDHFNSLLQYSNDENICRMINRLAKIRNTRLTYEYDFIAKGIDSLLPDMDVLSRASLCIEFLGEYQVVPKGCTPPRFILDSDNRPVNDNQIVFLPPDVKDGDFPQPPKFASLVFMQRGLLSAFRSTFGTTITLRALSEKLSVLNVREYNLSEMLRSVISTLNNREHQDSKNTKRCCVDTIQWLWKIYKSGRLQDINLQTFKIPIIARDGRIRAADSLYKGIEYGNEIAENLFEQMDDIFVASPKVFEISLDDYSKFSEFISVIGIVNNPRLSHKDIRQIPSAYGNKLLHGFEYPLVAEDSVYRSYSDMKIASITRVTVEVIEHYENILENSTTKNIIAWLRSDEKTRSLVMSEYELSQKSAAYITKGNQQYARQITNAKIACFMHYEFSNRLWIEVGGKRFAIGQCLLRNGIDELLLPYAVEPDMENYIVNHNQAISEKAEIRNILSTLGAAETFAELSTDALYGILLALPSCDENGEISKALYQSIIDAHGLSNFDMKNTNYTNFMANGKVFCKNIKAFSEIKNVNYLTEKTVSKEILKEFNLIAIPSRQNQDVIKRYFGVGAIKLKGSIIGNPGIHDLDREFANDFGNFKVFAFCYRVRNAKQSEIKTIKSLKVRLCNEIVANYGKDEITLDDYSYIRGNNGVFVKSPKGIHSIEMLRNDLSFCATMAEIITSTIDIQDERLFQCLRSLFGQNDASRLKMIIQDFDDPEVLTVSKEILDHNQTQQEMFLLACEQLGGVEKLNSIRKILGNLNLTNINDIVNQDALREILQIFDIDVPEFNDNSEFNIDFRVFYKYELDQLTEKYRQKYKNALFAMLSSRNIDEQKGFLRRCNSFVNHVYELNNTKNYNVKNAFMKQWPLLSNDVQVDADEKWIQNHEIFAADKDNQIVTDLLANIDNDSLLYFGCFDELTKSYDIKAKEWKKQSEIEANIQKPNEVPIAPMEIVKVIAKSDLPVNGQSKKTGNRSAGTQRERNKALWGAFAEEVVYKSYCQFNGDVKWVSENAKKRGVNPDGVGGLGYDLTYVDTDGVMIYVEIKSTTGSNISFIITDNELSFAEKNHQRYEVALLTNIESNNRKIHRLKDLFSYTEGEDRHRNSRFALSSDEYSVDCVIEQQT